MADSQLAQGTYDVLRNRLREGARELRARLDRLHADRAEVFGNIETKLLSTIHVTTEHNCIPRDLFAFSNHLILGCNVQFGLKSEIAVGDIFSSYRYDGSHASSSSLGPLEDTRFHRDFSELVRYYRGATFLRFWRNGPHLYMVFQTGKTTSSIKAFKWAIEKDTIHYVDNRSETEIKPPNPYSFVWKRATRESHRHGEHPHISIEDRVFVECVHGDMTIKVEDNTEDGLGIYREPVDSPDQTLDDAETQYAILDNLVLLKIKPYQERDFRFVVFSEKRSEAKRLDGIGSCCVALPDDHGIIFPNGYMLQSGDTKLFEHGLSGLSFDGLVKSPNGEDFLYLFTDLTSGTYLQLRYNLIRQTVDTPLICHGQAFLHDGHMLSMRAGDVPQKHHAIQVWQTPFTSPDFRPVVQSESLLFKIGNQDLVRGMAECQEILSLVDKEDSYAGLYADLSKRATDVLDAYFWIDREEAGTLGEPIRSIREAASAAVEEFEKVVRVKQQTEKALLDAQNTVAELTRKIDRQRFDSIEVFVESLSAIRSQRGAAVQLKELRYIDLPSVEAMEKQLVEFSDRLGNRCVQHLLQPESLAPYRLRITELSSSSEKVTTAADGKKLDESYGSIGTSLELLIETVSQLRIEDTTQRTLIVDRIADALADLNRVRTQLRARLRDIVTRELESDFASQSKLLDQSLASAMENADEPDKIDAALTRLLIQIEELEGRYADSEELLLRLTEKRQSVADAFEAKRVQLVEARTKRANGLVLAADRILQGIASKANRIDDPNTLRSYFASDLMVEKVRQICEQLKSLGDSVRQEDVLSRLKSIADDSMRQQRDRRELLSDGNRLITLGRHAFSVNQQATELTTVVRNDRMHLHITGTQYFEPIDAPELESAKDLWDAPYPSESQSVYRSETLAFLLSDKTSPDAYLGMPSEEQVAWVRDFMQTRYQEGYARGVHDLDAAKILRIAMSCRKSLGLLRFSPVTRARAMFAWTQLVPETVRTAFASQIAASHAVDKLTQDPMPNHRLLDQAESVLREYAPEFLNASWEKEAASFLVESLSLSPASLSQTVFSLSPNAIHWGQQVLSSLSKTQWESLTPWLQQSSMHPMDRWHLANRLVTGFRCGPERLVMDLEYHEEIAWVLLQQDEVPPPKVEKGPKVTTPIPSVEIPVDGMVGDHTLIRQGVLPFHFYEFERRLRTHVQQVMPRWYQLQQTKHALATQADKKLRTHELKARVLTSFVRNQLIDSVYLPRIGDNLAKQIGASGENKRTDRMGLLLLISPPGYGKTTLMEYIANRLGLVFVKVNGPALGHSVRSLDPSEATNAAAREEVERINLALEIGDNTMLYLDDIQHCNVELLQKFIPLCDATRRIEGVWKGNPRTYDLRGRKFAVVMAGNPYNESGERFQIPDMLANRADVYNLGEIIGDSREAFEMSYLENCLTSNPTLQALARCSNQDQRSLIQAALRGSLDGLDLEANLSSDSLSEMFSVLQKLHVVRDAVLVMNREYIKSAAQSDDYRTEPPFKLQGSYRNMNRIAEKVVPIMNDAELQRLLVSSYEQDAQTLSRDGESNILKFRELLGLLTPTETERWKSIQKTFVQKNKLKGLSGDESTAQFLTGIQGIQEGLESIGDAVSLAVQSQSNASPAKETTPDLDPKVIVQHSVPRVMTELIRSQFQLLYDGLRPVLEELMKQRQSNDKLREAMDDCLVRYKEMETKANEGQAESE